MLICAATETEQGGLRMASFRASECRQIVWHFLSYVRQTRHGYAMVREWKRYRLSRQKER